MDVSVDLPPLPNNIVDLIWSANLRYQLPLDGYLLLIAPENYTMYCYLRQMTLPVMPSCIKNDLRIPVGMESRSVLLNFDWPGQMQPIIPEQYGGDFDAYQEMKPDDEEIQYHGPYGLMQGLFTFSIAAQTPSPDSIPPEMAGVPPNYQFYQLDAQRRNIDSKLEIDGTALMMEVFAEAIILEWTDASPGAEIDIVIGCTFPRPIPPEITQIVIRPPEGIVQNIRQPQSIWVTTKSFPITHWSWVQETYAGEELVQERLPEVRFLHFFIQTF